MDQKKIDRINALYHKSKAEGLTEAEKKEQALLQERVYRICQKQFKSTVE